MKKIISAMALVAAVAASGASIQWNLSLGRSGLIADSTGAALNGNLYLVLTSSAGDLASAAESDTFAATLDSVALDSMTLSGGKNTATKTTTSPRLVVDQNYSFSLVVYDAANSQYYLSSALGETAYDETAAVVTPTKVTFTATMVGSTSGKTWASTSVPEPATAALALLGLGLMIKRRKA